VFVQSTTPSPINHHSPKLSITTTPNPSTPPSPSIKKSVDKQLFTHIMPEDRTSSIIRKKLIIPKYSIITDDIVGNNYNYKQIVFGGSINHFSLTDSQHRTIVLIDLNYSKTSSNLLNTILNYLYEVRVNDDFRFHFHFDSQLESSNQSKLVVYEFMAHRFVGNRLTIVHLPIDLGN
jgi:hypothetical protein